MVEIWKTIDANGSHEKKPLKNHRHQWFTCKKKPLKNHRLQWFFLAKTITIPLWSKFYHRSGLFPTYPWPSPFWSPWFFLKWKDREREQSLAPIVRTPTSEREEVLVARLVYINKFICLTSISSAMKPGASFSQPSARRKLKELFDFLEMLNSSPKVKNKWYVSRIHYFKCLSTVCIIRSIR